MINKNLGLLVVVLVILFLIINIYYKKKDVKLSEEAFRLFYESSPSTRNMSYDLRCEPVIPKLNYGIMDSSIQPQYRSKCLELS